MFHPGRFPPAHLYYDLTFFHRLTVAIVQSEERRLTLRHEPAPQLNTDYSHYCPTRADERVGSHLRCITPLCCPHYSPLDQSATIHNLYKNPSRMLPLQTPFE
jgi:hypothetical protein